VKPSFKFCETSVIALKSFSKIALSSSKEGQSILSWLYTSISFSVHLDSFRVAEKLYESSKIGALRKDANSESIEPGNSFRSLSITRVVALPINSICFSIS
jgi:hypothetical protein